MRFRGWTVFLSTPFWLVGTTFAAPQGQASTTSLRPLIERELRSAALETGVPYELLAGIAYLESRWTALEPDGEHAPAYGVMGLKDDEWFGSSLSKAARLLDLPVATLKTDLRANIRGAAHLILSHLSHPDPLAKTARSLLSWKNAVLDFTGIPGTEDRELYWDDLAKRLARGHSQGGIHIRPSTEFRRWLGKDHPDLDEIEWDPSPNFDAGAITPRYVVIHTTQGSFASAVSWLKNPKARVSAHYVVRASDGFIKNLVRETDRAWHVRCWNPVSIGIEHEGFVEDPESYTETMVEASSRLTKKILGTYSIPADDMHVFGHDFWTTERYRTGRPDDLPNCNDHTDPGTYWDWTRYFELLRQ